MVSAALALKNIVKDPITEIQTIREGLDPKLVEIIVLSMPSLVTKDVLHRLNIPTSTYFAKKKGLKRLDSASTEKFLRLHAVIKNAVQILGEEEAGHWLYRKIPSLDNHVPIDLLDTEIGHRLVEEALLQIKYGIYG